MAHSNNKEKSKGVNEIKHLVSSNVFLSIPSAEEVFSPHDLRLAGVLL